MTSTGWPWQTLLLLPVAVSGVYWIAATMAMARFFGRRPAAAGVAAAAPNVSLVKPVCGLEKELFENLETACQLDYPAYEVIFAVQDPQDPALPVLERIRDRYPDHKIRIVVDATEAGPNGKVSNLLNATRHATGEVLVYSDSDMRLEPDYLRALVAPLADPRVGLVCPLYRAAGAANVWERLELLALNAEFVPSMVFATEMGLALASPGASQAMRRATLERLGGLAPLADALAEDLELGRLVRAAGLEVRLIPYVTVTRVDLPDIASWWRHQVYWNQNTRVASPIGFFFTWIIRGVPFAALYALSGGPWGGTVLGAALALRLGTALATASFLRDRELPPNLWLLPLHDMAGMLAWCASLFQRTIRWRGRTYRLQAGRLVARS